MKKSFLLASVMFLFSTAFCFAEIKLLYECGIYGQTFYLFENSDETGKYLAIQMCDYDVTPGQTSRYDSRLPMEFLLFSDCFTDHTEYARVIERCKVFLWTDMCFVYLKDMKDICDIACMAGICTPLSYCVKNNGKKHIEIAYDCTDLELLLEMAVRYHRDGRVYVFENYVK